MLFWILLLAPLLLVPCRGGALHDVTPQDVERFIVSQPAGRYLFLNVYAPWCEHCKAFDEADWPRLAGHCDETTPANDGSRRLELARLDGFEHRLWSEQHGVKGYPMFLLFESGKSDSNPLAVLSPKRRTVRALVRLLNRHTNLALPEPQRSRGPGPGDDEL
eukprot:TRINITY_DN24565_c0_g1_i1.p1 TRINITY_DN24565_c0_g1~~TRINITY_DN24565_c0_g1_i1.p1  ORF type:complete len:162 (-),score=20.02 TRINITY_DN24565_c0_g1_i1:3-488(-)